MMEGNAFVASRRKHFSAYLCVNKSVEASCFLIPISPPEKMSGSYLKQRKTSDWCLLVSHLSLNF